MKINTQESPGAPPHNTNAIKAPNGRPADAFIHLRVQSAAKAKFVRASRQKKMKLTDWIVEACESQLDRDTNRTPKL